MITNSEYFGSALYHDNINISEDIDKIVCDLIEVCSDMIKLSQEPLDDNKILFRVECEERFMGTYYTPFGLFILATQNDTNNYVEVEEITLQSNMYGSFGDTYKSYINRYQYDLNTNKYTDLNDECLSIYTCDNNSQVLVNKLSWDVNMEKVTHILDKHVRKIANKISGNTQKYTESEESTAITLNDVEEYIKGYPIEIVKDKESDMLYITIRDETSRKIVSINAEQMYKVLKSIFQ